MSNIFKARLSHGIGAYLLMVCLGRVGNLKSKLKSNWNYIKIKLYENENMTW